MAFRNSFYVTTTVDSGPVGLWLALNLRRANIDVLVAGSLLSCRREEPPLQGARYHGLEDKDVAELMKWHRELNQCTLQSEDRSSFRYPELNALWVCRIAGFREPTARYIKVAMDEEASTHKGCNEDLLIGTSATYLAIGKDGEELFRATKPNYFVLLTCTYDSEATGLMRSFNARLAVRLTN